MEKFIDIQKVYLLNSINLNNNGGELIPRHFT